MRKDKKKILIESIRAIVNNYSAIILVHLCGMNAAQSIRLRSSLWEHGADVKVVKNSLLKIVLLETSFANIFELNGEVAILYSNDGLSLSKLLCSFMRENDGVGIISMIYENAVLSQVEVKKIASLPSLMVLQSQLISIMNCGVSGKLMSLLELPKRQVFNLVKLRTNG